MPLTTAGGILFREQIVLEFQMVDFHGEELTPWFAKLAVITPESGVSRLPGRAIKYQLYVAAAPGNDTLYVSRKKNGIVCQLPVVQIM